MRKTCSEPDIQMDTVFSILDKPLPPSLMTDPKHFLSINEDAIWLGLDASRHEQRRIILTRYAAAFGVFTALAMLLTFSREARAFAREIFYTIIEWFSPAQNESGVTFDIEDSPRTDAPNVNALDPDRKLSFVSLDETDGLYSHNIYILNDPAFVLTDGLIQNETICLNYRIDKTKVQIIAEPIQDSGSISYHFNNGNFDKLDVPSLGTFYYDLTGGELFGGLMTSDTNIIISADENASPELIDRILRSLSLYR